MNIAIAEVPGLEDYSTISIAFEVNGVIDVAGDRNGASEWQLTERPVDVPYVKDYDQFDGEAPLHWATRFDLRHWGILIARSDGVAVGGAAVAWRTSGMPVLDGREDLAVLWDIRVAPAARGQGVGKALFAAAERWARFRGCIALEIETQNTNVDACRFYASQGCRLTAVHRDAYLAIPSEIQLIWSKRLDDTDDLMLRPLDESDSIEELTDLLHRSYANLLRMGLRYSATAQDADTTRSRVAKGECYVLVDGRRLVGTIVLYPPNAESQMDWCRRADVASFGQYCVDPAYQGRGLGKRLLDHVDSRARALGARELALNTARPASHLIALYERWGFRVVGEVQWGGVNYNSVVMSRPIVPGTERDGGASDTMS